LVFVGGGLAGGFLPEAPSGSGQETFTFFGGLSVLSTLHHFSPAVIGSIGAVHETACR
jgi:hypothetical protein